MIKINQTPYPTSKNYGINDIEIDEKIFEVNSPKFLDFKQKMIPKSNFLMIFQKIIRFKMGF